MPKFSGVIVSIRTKTLSNTHWLHQGMLKGKMPHFRLACVAHERLCLRWLPRVFTNNPSYLAYVTERNLVTLSLRFCSRDSPLRLPI